MDWPFLDAADVASICFIVLYSDMTAWIRIEPKEELGHCGWFLPCFSWRETGPLGIRNSWIDSRIPCLIFETMFRSVGNQLCFR